MSKKLLSIKIDVTKIDKSRLFKGEKGTYLNVTAELNDEKDKYGNNLSIWEDQTQEERNAKADRNYIGSGKIVWEGESKPKQETKPEETKDDLPF